MEENKGTGAGGAKTNLHGKAFERSTENVFGEKKIIGQKKLFGNAYYMEKDNIVLLTQGALKKYFKHFFKKEMIRCPDEAYLIRNGDNYTLKILEKKCQNVEGSVIEKLCLGQYIKEEYQSCLDSRFTVEYAFCLNSFLKQKYLSDTIKYEFLRQYNERNHIQVFFGDDPDYYEKLDNWIHPL
jgi:hypothetical protein